MQNGAIKLRLISGMNCERLQLVSSRVFSLEMSLDLKRAGDEHVSKIYLLRGFAFGLNYMNRDEDFEIHRKSFILQITQQ